MRLDFNGNWKTLLIIGSIGLAVFLLAGTMFSLVAGILISVLKGVGLLLGTVLRFSFSSITGFAVSIVVAYLIYMGYSKIKKEDKSEPETVEYTTEDFER